MDVGPRILRALTVIFIAGVLMLTNPALMILVLSILFGIQFVIAGCYQVAAAGRQRRMNH